MKLNGFRSANGIKNRAISASFDVNEQRMGHYILHCAVCNATMRVSEMTSGIKRNDRVYVILNHSGRAFSQNARIYKGMYFCGNCGRSRIWKNANKYKDTQELVSAIQAQATVNREYRVSAKVKGTTDRAKELIAKGNKEYGLDSDDLQELFNIYQETDNSELQNNILSMLENINYHTEYGQFQDGTFSEEEENCICGYASEREKYYKNMLEHGNRGILMGLAYYTKYRIAKTVRTIRGR